MALLFAAAAPFAFQAVGNLVENGSGIDGVGPFVAGIARLSVGLARRAGAADGEAAAEMVALMRARVPQDTGALLNGIMASVEDGFQVVRAQARNPFDAVDYAPLVERGVKPMTRRRAGAAFAHPGMTAQPFFWPSVREVAEKRNLALQGAMEGSYRESGL